MISATETIILTALRVALNDLRRNDFLIDDIMCQFKTDKYLKNAYANQTDRMKDFLKRQINVSSNERLPDYAKLPAIVLNIGDGVEDQSKQGLGDSPIFEDVSVDALQGAIKDPPNLILGPTTPESYDSNTGVLTFTDALPNNVFEGQLVNDTINNKSYVITLVLDQFSVEISTGLKANFTNMTISPQFPKYKNLVNTIWFYETYKISCFSTDPNELLFLYSIVLYILGRYKKTLLEARNFEITTHSYSQVYNPLPPGESSNLLWARDITIRGRVAHTFIQSTSPAIEGLGTELLIDPTGGNAAFNTPSVTPPGTYNPQVKDQGWEMINDPEAYDSDQEDE